MFKRPSDGPFIPVIQRTTTLVIMALVAVICFGIAYFSRVELVSPSYELKVQAAKRMAEAMAFLKAERMEKGIFIDLENDPNETGLVGQLFSLITTDEGDLDAKLTTLDPNFAAAMVDLLLSANLQSGDTVAVLMTGSMPGANMAMLIACEVLKITPVPITSVGASQWGANYPDFTWLDMEAALYEQNFISHRSVAASLGGRNDLGRLLSPKGRGIILNDIHSHGLPLIRNSSLKANIAERMRYFEQALALNRYAACINIGGGVAALGTGFNHRLLPPGVVYRADFETLANGGGIEGVVLKFARLNIPVIHILNIQALTENLGMPFAPIPLPEIGSGSLYAEERFNLLVATVCLIVVGGMVFGVGYYSHRQIKQRMLEHEPDSLL
ncbi:MAG: poly-gamma-glutamate system protein [Fidelibacterota bacterium]